MAYVGTPRFLGSARDTLASIIQGEAGGEGLNGMQAVGAVISNRAAQNFSGYGSDPLSQATARMQFQGQSSNPSANAYSVADAVLAGNNPDPTGGALYYANPGASSASWARNLNSGNALQIGNHFFTDNTRGAPFTGSVAPSSTNTGDGLGYASGGSGVDGSVGTQVQSESYTADSGTVVFGNAPDNADTATGGVDGASFSQANVSGNAQNGSFGLGGITSGGQTVASGDNIAGWNGAGPVQTNPAVVGAINQQGVNATSAITKGDQKIGNDVKTAGQTIGQSITNASQSWLSWAGDSLLRLFVLIIGIALFAGALYYFGKPAIDDAVAKMPKVVPV